MKNNKILKLGTAFFLLILVGCASTSQQPLTASKCDNSGEIKAINKGQAK